MSESKVMSDHKDPLVPPVFRVLKAHPVALSIS
jgi:hypothetical protein